MDGDYDTPPYPQKEQKSGASRNSFPEIQLTTIASAVPDLRHRIAPALSNRPLYENWDRATIVSCNDTDI